MAQGAKFTIVENVLIGQEAPDTGCTNAGELVLKKLKSKPHFMAQVEGRTGKHTTFAEMREGSVKCAIWLKRQGIQPGDIIGICVENHLDVHIPIFATLYVAGVICGWDDQMSIRYARYYVNLISPKLVFVSVQAAENLKEAARQENKDIRIVTVGKKEGFESLEDILKTVDSSEIDSFECTPLKSPTDVAMICLSSGTTGLPKGSEISHRSLINSVTPVEDVRVQHEVLLWFITVRWQVGLTLIIEAVLSEARNIIYAESEKDSLMFEYIDKYGITLFMTDPSVPDRWMKMNYYKDYPLRSLKKFVVTGASFNARKQMALANVYAHTQVLSCYGLTDAGGLCASQTPESKPGSCGFVCRGIQIKIADSTTGKALGANQTGEIWIKSPFIMNGYYKNPEATEKAIDANGWLHTNDRAYYDEEGEIFLVDRISEFINYRGIKLSPVEIEAVLESHESVMRAAVVPVPHEMDDEHPMAFVTKVPGREVTDDELMKLVADNLPDYCKLKAGIRFLDKMPLTATGKIARGELKEMAKKFAK